MYDSIISQIESLLDEAKEYKAAEEKNQQWIFIGQEIAYLLSYDGLGAWNLYSAKDGESWSLCGMCCPDHGDVGTDWAALPNSLLHKLLELKEIEIEWLLEIKPKYFKPFSKNN